MLRKPTGTDPIPSIPTDNQEREGKKKRIGLRMGIAALAVTIGAGLGAGAKYLFNREDVHAQAGSSPEVSAPLDPTETTTPEPEAPAPTSETTEPSPSTEHEQPSAATFEAPESVTAATVRFKMANGEVVEGTEGLLAKVEIPYTPGMTNHQFNNEFVKSMGLLVNVNTGQDAIDAYNKVGKDVNDVVTDYVTRGVAPDAFGEGGTFITDYIASVNAYNRQQTKDTGRDHGCIYVITKPPTVESPLDETRRGVGVTEKCGVMEDGKLVSIERERDVQFSYNATIGSAGEPIKLKDSEAMPQ